MMKNDIEYVEYKVGYRMYLDSFIEWHEYRHHYSDDKELSFDSDKKEYYGDSEIFDDKINSFNPKIQRYYWFKII